MKGQIWKLYILLIPVHWLLFLPVVGHKVQIPELVFLIWLIISYKDFRKLSDPGFRVPFDYVVLLWPFAIIIPGVVNGFNAPQIFELVGAFYLVTLYFLLRVTISKQMIREIPGVLVWSAAMAAILGISGWLLYVVFNFETPLILPRSYPYLGELAQIQALTVHPNMLASILMTGIILQYAKTMMDSPVLKSKNIALLTVLVAGMALTFSKTVIPMVSGLTLVTLYFLYHAKNLGNPRKTGWLMFSFSMLFFVLFSLVSHFYISKPESDNLHGVARENFITETPLKLVNVHGQTYGIYPVSYYHNKKAALLAFQRSGFWGVGGGNFNSFTAQLKKEGVYPEQFPDHDPNSSWSGIMAELGIPGMVIMLVFASVLGCMAVKNLKKAPTGMNLALMALLMAILTEAVAIDVMNFRHYWVVFGLVASEYASLRS